MNIINCGVKVKIFGVNLNERMFGSKIGKINVYIDIERPLLYIHTITRTQFDIIRTGVDEYGQYPRYFVR